jgi:hypothetical protein
MSRAIRRVTASLFVLLTLASVVPAAPAPGGDTSPLTVVPTSAPIVVYLRGVDGTKAHLIAMLKNAIPEMAGAAEAALDAALNGTYTDGRKPRGLVKDGPIFGVFTEMPKPGEEPKMAFILAITKYEEFRDNVLSEEERKSLKSETGYDTATLASGEAIFFVNKKEYVVVAQSKEVAETFTKKQKGIDGQISKEQASRLLAGDAGLYLSMDAINKAFGPQIKLAKEQAPELLKTLAESAEKRQRASFDLLQKMLDPIFQAVEDSHGILLTAEFRPNGLAIHLESEFRSGTPTAKMLDGNKLSTFEGLDKMPAGQMIYVGTESSKSLLKLFGSQIFGVSDDPKENAEKALQEGVKALIDADPGTRINFQNFPMSSLDIARYADPAKAIKSQLQLLQAYSDMGMAYGYVALKGKAKITPKAQKYQDIEFTSAEMAWDMEKTTANIGGATMPDDMKKAMAETFKKMLGDKQTIWLGTDGKEVVQVAASDWAAAEKSLDAYFKGTNSASKQANFRDVRKGLPAETSMLALVDLVRYFDLAVKPMLDNAPLPFKLPALTGKVPPTYCGFSGTLKADRAGADIFISAATVHEIYKAYVLPLMGGAAS